MSFFHYYNHRDEILAALKDVGGLDLQSWSGTRQHLQAELGRLHNLSTLELVEELAEVENHPYFSEEVVSEIFDRDELPGVLIVFGENDQPAIREAYNDWTDSLNKAGELHDEQFRNYGYVGTHAERN